MSLQLPGRKRGSNLAQSPTKAVILVGGPGVVSILNSSVLYTLTIVPGNSFQALVIICSQAAVRSSWPRNSLA